MRTATAVPAGIHVACGAERSGASDLKRRPAMWLAAGAAAILLLVPAVMAIVALVAPNSLGVDLDPFSVPTAVLALFGLFKWAVWALGVGCLGLFELLRMLRGAQ